jgi:hypothetical protein
MFIIEKEDFLMTDNGFFKLTPLYKEFILLDMIEKNSNITQRTMSNTLGVALSMINSYLDDYESNGFITRDYKLIKSVEYNITPKGIERKKLLNISYLKASQKVFNSAKENIVMFLNQIIDKGFKNILLYGAGEVAEILLNVIYTETNIGLKVLAVVDDDINKQGNKILDTIIISKNDISKIKHDGLLISTIQSKNQIMKNIKEINYDLSKVISL